ncbi:MAG: helicase C-terminal domain-containing protein [Candidatus Pacebacteria bacterium]|nr:helicase C-terminal domain-containing protein [Candidatus Paceibacterota bacterium]
MEIYFSLVQYAKINEFFNQEFVFLLEKSGETISASIKCLNASQFIRQTVENYAQACTFFSATLDPIEYYKTLLTEGIGNDVKMVSPFKQGNLLLLIADHVSTRYNDRADSIKEIAYAAKALISGKKGNYILFFPSYEYLKMVEQNLDFDPDSVEIIRQTRQMSLQERSSTMTMFKTENEKTQVGLFVMGGVFGESIDLIGDMLSGVLIVGVGLPALSPFNNILRSHFDIEFNSGFDYAYTYPGLNKVIQAVGRVIRTETDRGVAILMDDRFASSKYLRLYPKEWSHVETFSDTARIKRKIAKFWKAEENI